MNTKPDQRPKTKCVIYARLAREDGNALQQQIEAAKEFAESRNLDVVGVFADIGSGNDGVADRPGLAGALKTFEEGTAGALVVCDFDRIARNYATTAEVGRHLEQHGVIVHVPMFSAPIDLREPHSRALGVLPGYEPLGIGGRTRRSEGR